MVEPEHRRLQTFCRKLMSDKETGDDLYQDSLVSALTGFPELKEIGFFRTWLYRIVINNFINRRRSPWWKKLVPMTAEIGESIGKNPESAYIARRRIEMALEVLSPDDRVLIILFGIEGWSIAELARMMEKSEGTIKVRLSRARKKMRKKLIQYLSQKEQKTIRDKSRNEGEICVVEKSDKQ